MVVDVDAFRVGKEGYIEMLDGRMVKNMDRLRGYYVLRE